MKQINRSITLFLLFGFFANVANAQKGYFKRPFEEKRGFILSVQYGFQKPAGDLLTRFGDNSTLGLDVKFKTEKGWIYGGSYSWMFSKNVKETTIFDSILGPTDEIIDKDGLFSVIKLNERGHLLFLEAGKVFQFSKRNRNSGLMVHFGAGYMMHRIDIQASTIKVPQITGDYEKGYDRFTGGLALSQYIGYQYLDPKKRVNFNIGFSFQQGFTKSLRPVNFDTRLPDLTERLDLLSGIKIGIAIPIYTKRRDAEMFFED